MSPPSNQSPYKKEIRPRSPWQFGLRDLMLLIVAASLLFYVMGRLGTLWSVAIVWLLVLAGGHMFANAWGSTVSNAKGRRRDDGNLSADSSPSARQVDHALDGRLALRSSIPRSRVELMSGMAGALAGATLGAVLLSNHYWKTAGYAALALGTVSFGVIGGFFGFLVGSFLRVTIWALREARTELKPVSHNAPPSATPGH